MSFANTKKKHIDTSYQRMLLSSKRKLFCLSLSYRIFKVRQNRNIIKVKSKYDIRSFFDKHTCVLYLHENSFIYEK